MDCVVTSLLYRGTLITFILITVRLWHLFNTFPSGDDSTSFINMPMVARKHLVSNATHVGTKSGQSILIRRDCIWIAIISHQMSRYFVGRISPKSAKDGFEPPTSCEG